MNIKEYRKQYYINNKDKWDKDKEKRLQYKKNYRKRKEVIEMEREYRKQYYINNKDKIKAHFNKPEVKEYRKKYYQTEEAKKKNKEHFQKKEVKDKINARLRRRYKEDKEFKIVTNLRNRLKLAIKYYKKTSNIPNYNYYNIDYENIISNLKPFPKNIKEYHIDHVIPLSWFDFNNPKEIEWAFAPENHQWLKAEDNLRKGGRYI